MVQSSFVKMLVGNSAITEVNELKYIKFTFKIFWMHIFHIYSLKSKWQNQINFKINVKMKEKIFLALVSKINHPKKYQVSKCFIQKEQAFMNWLYKIIRKLSGRTQDFFKNFFDTTKNQILLKSFLRPDRKISELGPPLIKKVISAREMFMNKSTSLAKQS